jgi:hypothetical protein
MSGSRVGINLNGELGNYFRIFKGLRQEDPLSPPLFNLVDGLATLLTKARDAKLIRGLVPGVVEGGLTHLHHVDDTITFLEADRDSITHIKVLLYCFENMSSLKINYQMSEIMVVGASKEENSYIANMLNCREGVLPIKYLGSYQ